MFDKIVKMIKEYEQKGDFTYAVVTDEMLVDAERRLNVNIPKQYVCFLKKYGHGGLDGIETLGIGKNGRMMFVDETLQYREYGLDNTLIVIENCDEWLYCISSITGKVIMWSRGQRENKIMFQNFDEYLLDRVNDAIDNM